MDKEDQIIAHLQSIELEAKLIRNLLTAVLALVSILVMVNVFSG